MSSLPSRANNKTVSRLTVDIFRIFSLPLATSTEKTISHPTRVECSAVETKPLKGDIGRILRVFLSRAREDGKSKAELVVPKGPKNCHCSLISRAFS